jgi:hypothetical protein
LQEKVEIVYSRDTAIYDSAWPWIPIPVRGSLFSREESLNFPNAALMAGTSSLTTIASCPCEWQCELTGIRHQATTHLGDAIPIHKDACRKIVLVAFPKQLQPLCHHAGEVGNHLPSHQPDCLIICWRKVAHLLLCFLYLHARWKLGEAMINTRDNSSNRRLVKVAS